MVSWEGAVMQDLIQQLRNLYVQHGTNYVQQAADELEKHQDEIERLADELNAMKEWKDSMRDKMEALKAQAAKDAADAGRYRWLTEDHADAEMRDRVEDMGIRLRWIGKGAADAAIDSSMKESPQ